MARWISRTFDEGFLVCMCVFFKLVVVPKNKKWVIRVETEIRNVFFPITQEHHRTRTPAKQEPISKKKKIRTSPISSTHVKYRGSREVTAVGSRKTEDRGRNGHTKYLFSMLRLGNREIGQSGDCHVLTVCQHCPGSPGRPYIHTTSK